VTRYYFHLASQHETIPDEDGVEVTALAEACAEAVGVVEELRQSNPAAAAKWKGWSLDVADASGAIVFSISLDEAFP
jgi:hypothetical protein